MFIIGIDPGITGAICFFEDGQVKDIIEMPNMADGKKIRDKLMDHKHIMKFYRGLKIFLIKIYLSLLNKYLQCRDKA